MFALVLLLMILFSFCVSIYVVSLLMKERANRGHASKETARLKLDLSSAGTAKRE